jgi:DNA uptake protein ComE-like DNA-binding protein
MKMSERRYIILLILGLIITPMPVRDAAGQFDAEPANLSGVAEPLAYALLEASTLPSPDGVHPVFRPADASSKPAQEAARLLEQSYARQALVLHQYVKNYLAHQPGVDATVATEPTYLFLGGSGGYADLGFLLEDAQGQLIDKRTTSYVGGLSISEGYFGDFEQIFPHELGHAILQELSGWQQGVLAAQIHQVTLLTDYFYAFNEGWAEHFQAVAVDHTANVGLQALREMPLPVGEQGPYARLARELKGRCLLCPATLSVLLWHNQREGHLRYAGVKDNIFAYQPSIPEVLVQRDDSHDALLYQAIIPPDSSGTFRNGPQMLANEGLISALFYQLVNDPRLQQTYRQSDFYEPFLPPRHNVDWSQTSPREVFSPMENVYLKLFRVFARHVRLDGDPLGESPTTQMVKGYAMDYPDEAEVLYDVFLEVTQGVTVEPQALQMAQNRAAGGLPSADHQAYLGDLRQRLLAGQVKVDSALGPQIWLRNLDTQVGIWLLDVYRSLPTPYHFNLNAATVVDLRTVPGVDALLARQIVQVRDERGGFNTLEDLAGIPGMTPEVLDRFRSMERAMHTWINQGAGSPEDEGLRIGPVIWSLVRTLLVELAIASAVAGLIFAVGGFLQEVSATRLGLAASPADGDRAGGKGRRIIGRVGWIFVTVVLPITILFLNNSPQVYGFAFVLAFAVWLFFGLPRLGWRFVRHQLSGRAALHRAVWALITYVAVFGTVGWLMGG